MNSYESLQRWADRALRIGILNKFDNHLTEPLYKNITALVHMVHGQQPKQVVMAKAHELEGSLLVCASVQLAPMPDIDRLIADLHDIVDTYSGV